MKAVVKTKKGKGNVQYMDMPLPKPDNHDLIIKINTAGICGTDLHIFDDEFAYKAPVIMGHEFSGNVVEVGKSVSRYFPGDRVVALTAVETCGHCQYCREGLIMLCDKRKSIGSGVNGTFAEYLAVPEHAVFRIPDSVSLLEATLLEPLSCVVRSVLEVSRIKAGDRVLVAGPGTIGQLVCQTAAAAGAQVFAVGLNSDKERLELAKQYGVEKTFIATDANFFEQIMEGVNGRGIDIVFECSGSAASAENLLKCVRKSGQYVQVGLFGKTVPCNFDLALTKEVDIKNSFGTKASSWGRALQLAASHAINLNPLISETLPLKEWESGFEKARNQVGYKILLDPQI